jgi:hypothetical protein
LSVSETGRGMVHKVNIKASEKSGTGEKQVSLDLVYKFTYIDKVSPLTTLTN